MARAAKPPPSIGGFTLAERPPGATWSWPVYRGGEGPPVIVIHELFGLTAPVLAYADCLVADGFTVWLPVIFGPAPAGAPWQQMSAAAAMCVSFQVNTFRTGRTSRVVRPLRALAAHVKGDWPGVGVVGMCFSGGFAIAMAADEAVIAGVASQPSLPMKTKLTPWCGRALGISRDDVAEVTARLATDATALHVTHFSHDKLCPPERVEAVKRLGTRNITVDPVPSGPGNEFGFGPGDHSVLAAAHARYRCGPAAERLAESAATVSEFLHARLGRAP